MDPQRLDRLLRICVVFGVGLPAAPYLLNFPHDPKYCFDIRLGDDVCLRASLFFLALACVVRAVTFSWMTPPAQRWLVVKALGCGAAWLLLPYLASYGRFLLDR